MPPKVDKNTCIGCGMCIQVCPANPTVFEMKEGKAEPTHKDGCIECGACESNCPVHAITLR